MKTNIRISIICLLIISFVSSGYCQDSNNHLLLNRVKNSPMQYFISLPKEWNVQKKWPVVIVLEAAEKEYKKNIERFMEARGSMPFILVAPIHTSNGNQGRRDSTLFPYSKETWDYIDNVGDCKFNDDGITKILKEVHEKYNTDDKSFITGFEAGTHTLWYFVFMHPELFKAAAPVSGNFIKRCITDSNISDNSSKQDLIVMGFFGEHDEAFGPKSLNFNQWQNAKDLCDANGFNKVSFSVIPKKGHEPMPKEVLNYFNSLLSK